MKKLILAVLLCCAAMPAWAQYAPTPHAAPRVAVGRESLAERKAAPPRDLEGPALILDGDKLRIGGYDLRLFGIVPPQLSASFGPQARAALDTLIGGGQSIECRVRDRDHDGRLLATCRAPNGMDPALVLLRQGLAVAARGSIAETEFAEPYVTAEQAAQAEKLGLWSLAPAAPAAPAANAAAEPPKPDAQKPQPLPQAKATDVQPKTASAVMPPSKPVVPANAADHPGLFARYQILIAGFLMLATALSILGALAVHRRREKRDEMKALAASLRGELLAARAVCATRIKSITTAEDDYASIWPRIRATLYQAYVGRLGWLGAELARQIASIYGLASDYAAYYGNLGDNSAAATPKKQALQALVAHIDEVLPRLAGIEQTGVRPALMASFPLTSPVPLVPEARVLPALAAPSPPRGQAPPPEKLPVETPPSATPAEQDIQTKLRSVLRHLRERFADRPVAPSEVQAAEYTAIIEEEAERYVFEEEEEGSSVSKISRN